MLRERRCTQEAINAEVALAIANAPPPPPGNTVINVLSIPSNHFLTAEQRRADYKWDVAAIQSELEQQSRLDPALIVDDSALVIAQAHEPEQSEPVEEPAPSPTPKAIAPPVPLPDQREIDRR
jgi:hypothetical protein